MFSLTFYLLIINLTAAGLMAYDKLSARHGGWRVPESSLFLLALLGGCPAIFVVGQWIRHKSSKKSFRLQLCIIMVVQLMLLIALLVK